MAIDPKNIATSIIGDSGTNLRALAFEYLGSIDEWEFLADINDINSFDDLIGRELLIPTDDYLSELKSLAESALDDVDLTGVLNTVNNWKSLKWV